MSLPPSLVGFEAIGVLHTLASAASSNTKSVAYPPSAQWVCRATVVSVDTVSNPMRRGVPFTNGPDTQLISTSPAVDRWIGRKALRSVSRAKDPDPVAFLTAATRPTHRNSDTPIDRLSGGIRRRSKATNCAPDTKRSTPRPNREGLH